MSHFPKFGSMSYLNNMSQGKIAASGSTTINPATGEVFAWHPHQTQQEVSGLLDDAMNVLKTWRTIPIEDRAAILVHVGAVLRRHRDMFAATMTQEMGKPIAQARAEVEKCAALFDWYAKNGPPLIADEPTTVENQAAYVSFLPLGVILGIMPWNYPLWQAVRAMVPVLLAGNCFVLKHAPNCTSTALNLLRAFAEAGAPTGLLSVLNIAQSDVQAVIQDDRIAGVTLTGSVRAGSAVASQAGIALKKTLLELGGSDPFIVLADADLERAVAAAVLARFQNSGQSCIAAKRIILEEAIRQEFTQRFVESVEELNFGDPLDERTYIGPMARTDLRDELADQVRRSTRSGAQTLLEGGPTGQDTTGFFKPTVLGGVEPGMAAFDEELFGPVAALVSATDIEHAIRLANQSQFGLSGAIWTANSDRAKSIARRLETGGVFINGYAASDARVPIGGVKKSGYGRELSHFGIREFTNAQILWVDRR
jgi:succinate-semialdehyde dehydrogenase